MAYEIDRAWADQPALIEQVRMILRRNAFHLIDFEISTPAEDARNGVDFNLSVRGGNVACRLRRANVDFRDLTLRAYRSNGTRTELQKMADGSFTALAYFYGWVDIEGTIAEWMLVDIQKVISSGLLNTRPIQHNTDQTTGFIAIPYLELDVSGYLFNRKIVDRDDSHIMDRFHN